MTRITTWTWVVLSCAALLVLASPARAAEVIIDQGTSVNGLPGCPHAGFPIIICHSGSYRLSSNLTISDVNRDGIDITADDVTLDLNGFTIAGPVTCTPFTFPVACAASGQGIGINSTNQSGINSITVHNGTVRGMGNGGINLFGSGGGFLVDSVHVDSIGPGPCTPPIDPSVCGVGIHTSFSTAPGAAVVTHSTVQFSAGDGILGGTIYFCTVVANGGNGISGAGVVAHCLAFNNGQDGVLGGFNVKDCTIGGNFGFGLDQVTGYGGNVIYNNGFGAVSAGSTSVGGNLCNGSAC